MSQLTKEESKEHAGLVRAIEAECARTNASDEQRTYRIGLMKAAAQLLNLMDIWHVLRLSEATAKLDYRIKEEDAFIHLVQCRLAKHYKLRELRSYQLGHQPAPVIVKKG